MLRNNRKLLTVVLCLALLCGLCVPAMAANYPSTGTTGYTITVTSDVSSLETGSEQNVTVTFTFNEAIEASSMGSDVVLPSGWTTKLAFCKMNVANKYDEDNDTVSAGSVSAGYDSSSNKISGGFNKGYGTGGTSYPLITGFTVKYTVPADAAVGGQTIGLRNLEIKKVGVSTGIQFSDATTTVTLTAPTPATGYGVNLSASDESVAKDDDINLYLDVVNASETTFNAFYATLTYDNTLVSYSGAAEISGFTVDSSTPRTLIISKTGDAVTIGDTTHELTLPFTADAAGRASFNLTDAKVDKAANAEAQNAPAATVTGSSVAVTITETDTYSVTVTLGANMSSSSELSQTGLTGAMTDVVVTPAAGYELAAPTITGSGVTATANADGSYTISGKPTSNVTVTFAGATVKAPTATTTSYFTGYTLIAATIDADGYVPTYDDNAMFTVEGYDANTYYYVVSTDYEATKLGYVAGTATNIAKSADVNQTGVTDINDAQFVYNIYNGTAPTANVVQRLLLADVNRDKTVNVSDCAAVVAAID